VPEKPPNARANSPALRARHVLTPAGVRDAVVVVEDGRIAEVRDPQPGDRTTHDLDDRWLLPGLVDTHVHVNEPGRAEWEGFATATGAALAGGVTTIVDMPLNSIPATTTAAAFDAKLAALTGSARCDVALWGGVVPGNAGELEALARRGVAGFKCFLAPSGVDEFRAVAESDLALAMPIVARLGLPLLVHAELPAVLDSAAAAMLAGTPDPRRYASWLEARPPAAEVEAIRLMIRMCERTGCRVHIVHLSAAEALPDLAAARARGLPLTVETCTHYLVFDAESIPDGGTEVKCAPPIRGRENRERLWQALERGEIDLVASDHSPCPPAMKRGAAGDFFEAWGGIASLEVGFAALWREAHARGVAPGRVVRWLAEAPARLAGLAGVKGAIAQGADADLVVWNPDPEWTVDTARLKQRHPVTPYAGRVVRGRVERVLLRGEEVWNESGPGAPAGVRADALVGAPRGRFTAPSVDGPRRIR
jgi:allantoinase